MREPSITATGFPEAFIALANLLRTVRREPEAIQLLERCLSEVGYATDLGRFHRSALRNPLELRAYVSR